MRHPVGNGVLGVAGAYTSYASLTYTHVNAAIAVMAALFGLIAAAFAAINGYYTWRRNRKEAAREAKRSKWDDE